MNQNKPDGAIQPILDRVLAGQRLTTDEALTLLSSDDWRCLATAAQAVRQRMHPGNIVTYIIDRNVSYTNVCVAYCTFCAFYRPPKSDEGYVLSKEEIFQKIDEVIALGGTGILMQGGLNPYLKIDFYEDLLRSTKERYRIHLHCFSPTEVVHIAKVSRLSVREVTRRLKAAGLDSIPGGGGEILHDDVRKSIHRTCTTEEWLGAMRVAHEEGLPTTATMVIGLGETLWQRAMHLERVRQLQDETHGFTAFIPWVFQPDNTELGKDGWDKATPTEYLTLLAVARLYLDNIPHLQTSWLTMGYETAVKGLHCGADDFGSTIIEENVVTAAGIPSIFPTEQKVRQLITEAGFQPQQRDTLYRHITSKTGMK